jgi:hypothetical protein
VLANTDERAAAYLEFSILPTLDAKLGHQSIMPDHEYRIDEFGFVVSKEECGRNSTFNVDVYRRPPSPFGNIPKEDLILGGEHSKPIRVTVDGDSQNRKWVEL